MIWDTSAILDMFRDSGAMAMSYPPYSDGRTAQVLVYTDKGDSVWISGHCPSPGVDPDYREIEAITIGSHLICPGNVYDLAVDKLLAAGYKVVPALVFGQ